MRAQTQRVGRLVRRSGEQNNVSAKSIGEFHSHVSQPAKADDTDLLALPYLPMTERRVSRDPRAKQRCHRRQVEVFGDLQHEAFVDYDAIGVAAVGNPAQFLVLAVISEDGEMLAELLVARQAACAGAARIHHTTNRRHIAFLEFFDFASGLHDSADDLVARYARINSIVPFVTNLVQIRMANPAIKNFDLHVVRTDIAALNRERRQGRSPALGRICFGCN